MSSWHAYFIHVVSPAHYRVLPMIAPNNDWKQYLHWIHTDSHIPLPFCVKLTQRKRVILLHSLFKKLISLIKRPDFQFLVSLSQTCLKIYSHLNWEWVEVMVLGAKNTLTSRTWRHSSDRSNIAHEPKKDQMGKHQGRPRLLITAQPYHCPAFLSKPYTSMYECSL